MKWNNINPEKKLHQVKENLDNDLFWERKKGCQILSLTASKGLVCFNYEDSECI